ncbi:hypothetical protein [Aurantibacter sp.]|uniref:hypothetical protein n=1 Tax=Aurantibacter sp. TaxID=2807103 RepID=UPI0035C7EE41
MTLELTPIKEDVLKVLPLKTGVLYFFKNLVCIEVNEGVHLDLNLSKEVFEPINSFYKDTNSIAFLSNRINDFSIEALDYPSFFKALPKIKLFTVVYYNVNNKYNIEIEKQFIINVPFKGFKSLKEAYTYSKTFINSKNIQLA